MSLFDDLKAIEKPIDPARPKSKETPTGDEANANEAASGQAGQASTSAVSSGLITGHSTPNVFGGFDYHDN